MSTAVMTSIPIMDIDQKCKHNVIYSIINKSHRIIREVNSGMLIEQAQANELLDTIYVLNKTLQEAGYGNNG